MLFNEIWKNRKIIYRLSLIDMRSTFKASILAYFWVFVSPLLMIAVYLFSFFASNNFEMDIALPSYTASDFSSTAVFENYSRLGWLIVGVVIWSYVGNVVMYGANSTRQYSWLVSKVGSPISSPPMITVLSKTYVGIITIIASWFIYMIIAGCMGYKIIDLNILQLPFMLILVFLFMSLWSLILSPFAAISKDIYNIVAILPMLLQWVSGVFLPLSKDNMNNALGIIFRINPFNFLIDNVRGSIIGNQFFWNDYISFFSFIGFFVLFIILALIINKRAKRVVVDLV